MIEIPLPLFISIYIALLIGIICQINTYLSICFTILFFGFLFSFNATPSIDITELFSTATSTNATITTPNLVDVFINIIYSAVTVGILFYLTIWFIRRINK
ncbi:hypothetical protein HmCmsJML052_04588 [Escherichia coli]|nr:hypothetical protein HmCmsJML052_04588 [Escherichia coli]